KPLGRILLARTISRPPHIPSHGKTSPRAFLPTNIHYFSCYLTRPAARRRLCINQFPELNNVTRLDSGYGRMEFCVHKTLQSDTLQFVDSCVTTTIDNKRNL